MTDLTKAIAELQRISVSKTEHLLAPHDEPFATILNAVLADALIPRADADLAVALMVEKACRVLDTAGDSAVTEALGQRLCCSGHDCGCRGADVGAYLIHLIRSEVAPASALAELQALRADRDRLEAANQKLIDMADEEQRARQSAEAELATLRAQVERLTGALTGIADFTEKPGHEFAKLHPKLNAALDAVPQDRWAEVLSEFTSAALTEGAAP